MYTLRRIAVPADFSECSRLSLDYAAFLGESIEILHQWHGPGWNGQTPEPLLMFARTRVRTEAEELLADLEARCPARDGGPGRCEITMRVGTTDDYDFIVVSSHARAPQSYLLVGSVAKKMLRELSGIAPPTPTVAAPPAGQRQPGTLGLRPPQPQPPPRRLAVTQQMQAVLRRL